MLDIVTISTEQLCSLPHSRLRFADRYGGRVTKKDRLDN